jgi:hypothetical protein
MKSINSDSELVQLNDAGQGFIYNDYSGKGASGKDYNILHAASCSWILKSNINVRKLFFRNLDEAIDWLNMNRGKEGISWKRCGSCRAVGRSATASSSIISTTPVAPKIPEQSSRPFVEAEVEQLLATYLRANGYQVQLRLSVYSGIVDIAANGSDGRWIIEVKGEDRGGYGSAEMNFQMGIGQLVSRMTNPIMLYALAFPRTSHYFRVLKKYHGSVGFERLGIRFFVVHWDGRVDKYDATAMAELIGSL